MKRLIDGNALASLFRTRRALDGNPTAQDAFETAMWDAAQAEEITLNALRDEVYQDAVAHGLWEGADRGALECAQRGPEWKEDLIRAAGTQKIWDEALELDEEWKSPERYAEELADVIIVSLSVAGKLGIDIDAAVRRKIEINKTRPWKHEGENHDQD